MFRAHVRKVALLSTLATLAGCHLVDVPIAAPASPGPKEVESTLAEDHPQEIEILGVEEIAPYFHDVMGGVAAAALEDDKISEARDGFEKIAGEAEDPALVLRARFLAEYLSQRLGENRRAVRQLPPLADELPLVADIVFELAATSAYRLKDYEEAVALSARVDPESIPASGAALVRADALRRLGRKSEAVAAYEEFVARWPDNRHIPEVLAGLVEALAMSPEGSELDEESGRAGVEVLARLRAQWPGSRWTVLAGAHEGALQRAAGEKPREDLREKKAAVEAYEKAVRQMNAKKNAESERTYNKVIRLAREGGRLACKAKLEKGVVISRQRRHLDAATVFDEVAGECEEPDIVVRALLKGGRSYMAADKMKDAIRLFAAIEEGFPEHSYADDARLYGARCFMALGMEETFREMVETIPELYPGGDMRAEALWTAALHCLKAEDLEHAADFLERYYDLFPVEDGWYTAGRSGYWLGRVRELSGRTDEAMNLYEHVISSSPFSYYMVLAYSRMHAADPERARQVMEELSPPVGETAVSFDEGLLEEHPGLQVGTELLRLGLVTRARREFDRILDRPETPAAVHRLVAALFRRMGRFNDAARATADGGWKDRYPTGDDLAMWTLAYPKAFEEAVEVAVEESGVDRALLWAVMREESGFNARVESWANAVGLMQLILPTARTMGKRIGVKVKKKSLKDPETNIRLGAAYLAYLDDVFGGHPALMIAGYNAGEGAVGSWRKERPDESLDLFMERIPFKQTRGYAKRVLASFATYKYLYEEGRPVVSLDMEIP